MGLGPRGRCGRAIEAQHGSVTAQSCDAKINVGIQIHIQFLRALEDVFAVHATRESLVFKLLAHTLHIYVEDRFRRFDERNSGQKTGQFIAGKEGLGEMRVSRYTGVLCMSHDCYTNLFRPSLLGKNLISYERDVLLRWDIFRSRSRAVNQ